MAQPPVGMSQPQIQDRPIRVVITDLDMPFFSMVNLMVKSALAAIPALFILAMIACAIFFMLSFCGALALAGRR